MSTADSKEPTMEEILASIRRIISEEGDAPQPEAKSAPSVAEEEPAPAMEEPDPIFFSEDDEDVLELTDTLQPEEPAPAPAPAPEPEPVPARMAIPPVQDDPLLSEQTVEATSQTLSSLSGLLVRNYPGSENTLEGLVRDMLRPMLKEWLDANLPDIVERTVAREVARISGRANR